MYSYVLAMPAPYIFNTTSHSSRSTYFNRKLGVLYIYSHKSKGEREGNREAENDRNRSKWLGYKEPPER